jgi:HD superfamily phosphohydrolase
MVTATSPQGDESERPWGLPRSVLAPGKVITDPVHGDIHLNKLEVAVIDSRPFQRLRRIRQLGNTHLVYPGAVHTRFSHCLGALRMAQILLDIVWKQSGELHGVEDDLFAEWRRTMAKGQPEAEWAKARILARLGALLHDLCHLPAGHTVEDDLRVLEPHDKNEDRFRLLWEELREDVPDRLEQQKVKAKDCRLVNAVFLDPDCDLFGELRPLVISKADDVSPLKMEYPFCADLVGNTICADLLDYLDRDHLFTGLPESLGRRFISAFFVTPSERGPFSERLALNIFRDGYERADIVSELLKALRYRYELSERALVHPAKLAADAMLGESIERWEWALWWRQAKKEEIGGVTEIEAHSGFEIDRLPEYRKELEQEAMESKPADQPWQETQLGQVRTRVREQIENRLRCLGDEGLLDFLCGLGDATEGVDDVDALHKASADLARDLKNRRLFKMAARVGAGDVSPQAVYKRYGAPADRAGLEAAAQRFAGLDTEEPQVLLWIPPPDMRLKLAGVLVQQESGIAPFVTYERSRSRRGSDIYDAHERLWTAYVYVRRDVDPKAQEIAAAYLGQQMGIRWEKLRYLGGSPDEWPLRLAVARVFKKDFKTGVEKKLEQIKPVLDEVAARTGGFDTFESLRGELLKIKSKGASKSSKAG